MPDVERDEDLIPPLNAVENERPYAPPQNGLVDRGVYGLTESRSLGLMRQGKLDVSGIGSKSRMPKDYTPKIAVPAGEVPSLSPQQIAKHELAIQNLARETGDRGIVPLKPKVNTSGNEYLPSEHFSFNRQKNEKINAPSLALSPEEVHEIFAGASPEDEIEAIEEPRRVNTHIAEFLSAEKFESNFADSRKEGEPTSNRGLLKNKLPSRTSNPSGLRGGSSTIGEGGMKGDLERGKKIYCPNLTGTQQEGGWKFVPREEWPLPTDLHDIQNRCDFLNSLSVDELALNAAKLESGFRIEDFAREQGWKINPAKRFQRDFNKKLAMWKRGAVDPREIEEPDLVENR